MTFDAPLSLDEAERLLRRQTVTLAAFVELADTLVDDFDVIDVLSTLTARSVELLDVAAAGILLVDHDGNLRVMAASSEQMRLLELFQLQNDEGPCLDAHRTGQVVAHGQLGPDSPWPVFAAESLSSGFAAVCAIPMRLREANLGCLNLFMSSPGLLPDHQVQLARALADVASIAIVHHQAARDAQSRERSLQHALNSRVVIEQAKGMIAERAKVDMEGAFSRLRSFARNNNRGLTEVAESLVGGTLSIDTLSAATSPRQPPPSV